MSRVWPIVVAIAAISAWLCTLLFAASNCAISDVFRLACGLTWQWPDPPKDLLEAKGQLGDVFGLLNGLFGATTLLLVFLQLTKAEDQLRMAQSANAKHLELLRLERYFAMIDTAVRRYTDLLSQIRGTTKGTNGSPDQHWAGRDALWHLWNSAIVRAGANQLWGYNSQVREGMVPSATIWTLIAQQLNGSLSNVPAAGDIDEQMQKPALDREELIRKARAAWQLLYLSNDYQLSSLYRAWYQVCRTLKQAQELALDAGVEWDAATQFRSQLSSIELTFLLMDQALGDDAVNAARTNARAISERYAMFEHLQPGLDPVVRACTMVSRGHFSCATDISLPTLSDAAFNSADAQRQLRSK